MINQASADYQHQKAFLNSAGDQHMNATASQVEFCSLTPSELHVLVLGEASPDNVRRGIEPL